MKRIPGRLALLVLCAAMAACVDPADHTVPPDTITLTQADAGRTVHASIGATVQVVLDEEFPVPGSSLVWSVRSSNASVLSPGTTTGQPSPGPGVKTFTYTADFRASATGQALLLAHGATTCEAMAKSSCPDKDFDVTVTVGS